MTEKHRTIDELTTSMEIHRPDGTWVGVTDIKFTTGIYGIPRYVLDLADGKFAVLSVTQEILSREVAS